MSYNRIEIHTDRKSIERLEEWMRQDEQFKSPTLVEKGIPHMILPLAGRPPEQWPLLIVKNQKAGPDGRELVSIREAVAFTGLAERTIRYWIKLGAVETVSVGRKRFIVRETLEQKKKV